MKEGCNKASARRPEAAKSLPAPDTIRGQHVQGSVDIQDMLMHAYICTYTFWHIYTYICTFA